MLVFVAVDETVDQAFWNFCCCFKDYYLARCFGSEMSYYKDVFLFLSKFSKELKCVSSAGVPTAPEPPKMDKAGVNSIHLSWSKPESKGG